MTPPSVAEFKAQFVRDFPYGSDSSAVMDADITSAITLAGFNVNEGLFATEAEFKFAYNYLAAHYLVMSIKASSQGLGGSFNWIESAKSVGSVSQSFAIPEKIMNNPLYAMFTKTPYGAMYLSLVLPLTYGNVVAVNGATQP